MLFKLALYSAYLSASVGVVYEFSRTLMSPTITRSLSDLIFLGRIPGTSATLNYYVFTSTVISLIACVIFYKLARRARRVITSKLKFPAPETISL